MDPVRKVVDRVSFPAESPFVAVTAYYVLLFALSAALIWAVPDLQQAVSGARLAALLQESLGGGGLLNVTAVPARSFSWEFSLFLGVAMLGAFLLMLPTSWVYMATRQEKGFDQNIAQSMLILGMAVAGVIVIVRNSLALAFSLAGIVGAVRFRNTLRDSRDTIYIFLAIGVGLAAGVEALAAAAVLSVVFNYIVLLLHRADYAMCELGTNSRFLLFSTAARSEGAPAAEDGKKPYNAVLVVRTRAADETKRLIGPYLDRGVKEWALAEEEVSQKGRAHLKYLIRLGRKTKPAEIEDALLQLGAPHVKGVRIH